MPKFNQYLIENKKPVELVQELEKYKIKKSPLSLAARGKVISKSGSGYVSEGKDYYGPCEYWDCPYSNNCRFYIRMGFSGGEEFYFREYGSNGSLLERFFWTTIKNIQQARNFLNKLEKEENEEGKYAVLERKLYFAGGIVWERNSRKEGEIKQWLHEQIKRHEAGKEVYEVRKDFNEGACSSVIM